jgi:molecular chaperone DnaJ
LSSEEVTLRIAPGTSNGRVLRVKGRGITKGTTVGDLLVTIEVQVPQRVEGEALEALKKYAEATADQDVRKDFNTKALQ